MKRLKIRALASALALAVAACDGDALGVDDVNRGEFEGDVSGDVRADLRGQAYSGSVSPGFHDVIVLTDPSEDAQIVFFDADDEFFEGSTTIRTNVGLEYAGGVVAQVDIRGRFFVATGGTLNLRDVTRNNIDGTARFRAVEVDEFDEVITGSEVIVEVAFRAEFAGEVDFNRSPSYSAARARSSR